MKKLTERLKIIVSFIEKEDRVIDIGTDHLKVPIFLTENNLCVLADGSDISKVAIEKLNNELNEKLKEKINIIHSDGLKKIELEKYNTIIISGMGIQKIINILTEWKLNHKIILQPSRTKSQNEILSLESKLKLLNYKVINKKEVFEKGFNYITVLAIKDENDSL